MSFPMMLAWSEMQKSLVPNLNSDHQLHFYDDNRYTKLSSVNNKYGNNVIRSKMPTRFQMKWCGIPYLSNSSSDFVEITFSPYSKKI